MMRCLALGLWLCSLVSPALGEIFTWTDPEGNVQFGDTPPQNQASKKVPLQKQSVGGLRALSDRELQDAARRATEAYYQALSDNRRTGELKRLENDILQYQEEAIRRRGMPYDDQCKLGYRQCGNQPALSYGEQREREALQRRAAAEEEEERQRQSKQRATSQYPPDYLEYIQGQCHRGVKLYCAKLQNQPPQ